MYEAVANFADANVTTHSHDGAGRVTLAVDSVGTESSTYDLMGHRTRFVDKSGNTISAVFDTAGRQSDQTLIGSGYAVSQGWRFDTAGRQNVTIDEAGRLVTDVFDAADRVIEHRAQQSGSTYATEYSSYSVEGLRTLSIDAAGLTTATTYDVAGRPTTIVMTGSGYSATQLYQYNPLGNQTFAVDGRGITTLSTYDLAGHPLVVNRGGFLTTTVYDDDGRDVQFTDSDGQFTSKNYDGDYLVTKTIAGPGSISETDVWDYDKNGATTLAMVTRIANGVTSSYTTDTTYDSGRKVQQHVHTGGTALDNQTWGYDHAGNVTYHVDNDGKTTHTAFDADYRMITQQVDKVVGTAVSLWSYESWTYDGDGHVTDDVMTLTMAGAPQVRSHHWVYDPAGHVTRESQLYGGGAAVTTYSYDPAGRLLQLTDPNNNATTFGYDLAGNKIWTHDANGYTSTSEFDLANRQTRSLDRDGRTIVTTYDPVGHETDETWYDSGATYVGERQYAFDNNGNLTYAVAYDRIYVGVGPTFSYTIEYDLSYDELDRVSEVDGPLGVALTMGYDGRGNRSSVSDSFGGVETSLYDTANQLASRQKFEDAQPGVDFTYDWLGRGVTETRREGTTAIGYVTTTFDADGNMTGLTQSVNGTTFADYQSTFDAAHELIEQIDHGSTKAFGYEKSGQLVTGVSSYSYDGAGNRTSGGSTPTTGNRLVTDGVWTYGYDNEGNVTSKNDGTTTWTYLYDNRNELFFGLAPGAVSVSLYGPFGERLFDTASGVYRVYDGWNPAKAGAVGKENFDTWLDVKLVAGASLASYQAEGEGSDVDPHSRDLASLASLQSFSLDSLTDSEDDFEMSTSTVIPPGYVATEVARYEWGDKVDQLLSRIDADFYGFPGYYETYLKWTYTDPLGSVRDVTSCGLLAQVTIDYDEYGNITSCAPTSLDSYVYDAEAFAGRYRWTTRELDSRTGLQNNRGRWYDAAVGRWMNQDPMGFDAGDSNLYRYVKNAPTNATDPSGWQELDDEINLQRADSARYLRRLNSLSGAQKLDYLRWLDGSFDFRGHIDGPQAIEAWARVRGVPLATGYKWSFLPDNSVVKHLDFKGQLMQSPDGNLKYAVPAELSAWSQKKKEPRTWGEFQSGALMAYVGKDAADVRWISFLKLDAADIYFAGGKVDLRTVDYTHGSLPNGYNYRSLRSLPGAVDRWYVDGVSRALPFYNLPNAAGSVGDVTGASSWMVDAPAGIYNQAKIAATQRGKVGEAFAAGYLGFQLTGIFDSYAVNIKNNNKVVAHLRWRAIGAFSKDGDEPAIPGIEWGFKASFAGLDINQNDFDVQNKELNRLVQARPQNVPPFFMSR